MIKWIYEWFDLPTSGHLNDLGNNGWELCGIDNGRFYFKKPKPKEKNLSDPVPEHIEQLFSLIINRLNETTKSEYTIASQTTRKCITARLNEGRTAKDFFDVIEAKSAEWLGSDMAQYLRPETLFGNKFEGYLQAARLNKPKEIVNKNMIGMQM